MTSLPKPHQVMVPYLGLSQSCREIRREFRPLWLAAHVVSLYDAELYLRSFPDTTSLTLYVMPYTQSDFTQSDFDILPLLKTLAAKPNIDITVKSGGNRHITGSSSVGSLMAVFGNRNEKWLQHISGGGFSHVPLRVYGDPFNDAFFPSREWSVRMIVYTEDFELWKSFRYDLRESGWELFGLHLKGLRVSTHIIGP
jgi:hypothetical protein